MLHTDAAFMGKVLLQVERIDTNEVRIIFKDGTAVFINGPDLYVSYINHADVVTKLRKNTGKEEDG